MRVSKKVVEELQVPSKPALKPASLTCTHAHSLTQSPSHTNTQAL